MPVYGAPKRSMARPTSSSISGFVGAHQLRARRCPRSSGSASSTSIRTPAGRARRRRGRGGGRSRPRPRGAPRWPRRRSPAPSSSRRTNARGSTLGDPGRGVVLRAAVDDEHGEVVVVLAGQRRQRVLEPGPRVAGDDHRHDRRVLGERPRRRPRRRRRRRAPRRAVDGRAGSGRARLGAAPAARPRAAPRRARRAVRARSSGAPAYRRAPPRAPGTAPERRASPEPARYAHPMITALAGGVGAARFLRGLVQVVDPADVTVVVNTGRRRLVPRPLRLPRPRLGHLHAGRRPEPRAPAGAWRARPSPPSTRSPATARTPGSASATATSPPTSSAPGCCATGATLQRGRPPRSPPRGSSARGCCPMTDDRVATRITDRPTGELAMQEWFVRERCEPPVRRRALRRRRRRRARARRARRASPTPTPCSCARATR